MKRTGHIGLSAKDPALAAKKAKDWRKLVYRSGNQRYRAETASGELLGYIRAPDSSEAYRKAAAKFSALGLKIREA